MPADAGMAPYSQDACAPPVAVLVALEAERACFAASGTTSSALHVTRTGPGAQAAEAGARAATSGGSSLLVSFGLAGGLAPEAASGSVLVPATVVSAEGEPLQADEQLSARLRTLLCSEVELIDGDLLTVDRILLSPEDKALARQVYGAAACDMEAAPIARVARQRGASFAVIKVIADSAADRLPNDVEKFVDASGRSLLGPVLAALLHPGEWRPFWSLLRSYREARRSMATVARTLASGDWQRDSRASRP
jgi:adenosylhomocysteine nucleosidase